MARPCPIDKAVLAILEQTLHEKEEARNQKGRAGGANFWKSPDASDAFEHLNVTGLHSNRRDGMVARRRDSARRARSLR